VLYRARPIATLQASHSLIDYGDSAAPHFDLVEVRETLTSNGFSHFPIIKSFSAFSKTLSQVRLEVLFSLAAPERRQR
jgi:hypothetical protein